MKDSSSSASSTLIGPSPPGRAVPFLLRLPDLLSVDFVSGDLVIRPVRVGVAGQG
jgi:hypothetical protein